MTAPQSPTLFNPRPLADKPSPPPAPLTTFERYQQLANQVAVIKHLTSKNEHLPPKICLWCGLFYIPSSPTSTHCTMKCAAEHRHHPYPPDYDPKTTSWCAHGNRIFNDPNHMLICCSDSTNCNCHYQLFSNRSTISTCMICGKLHRSLRNPLICSQSCAITYNSLTKSKRKLMLPFIKDRLKTKAQDFFMIALISRDTPASSDLLKSFTSSINHYDLMDYAEKTTLSTPVTTINRYSGYRLLISQYIYIDGRGSDIPPRDTYLLYTIKSTHLTNPRNSCRHKHIISKPSDPLHALPLITLISSSQIIFATSPDLLSPPVDYRIIAHRILYLTEPMSSLYETLPVITRSYPHISLSAPPLNYYILTINQLNSILNNFTRSSGHTNPISYNNPLFLATKNSLDYIPIALPSFNPITREFDESSNIPLCTDKQPHRNLADVYTM